MGLQSFRLGVVIRHPKAPKLPAVILPLMSCRQQPGTNDQQLLIQDSSLTDCLLNTHDKPQSQKPIP